MEGEQLVKVQMSVNFLVGIYKYIISVFKMFIPFDKIIPLIEIYLNEKIRHKHNDLCTMTFDELLFRPTKDGSHPSVYK